MLCIYPCLSRKAIKKLLNNRIDLIYFIVYILLQLLTANAYLCGIYFQSFSASIRNIARSFWHEILDKDRLSNTCKMLVEVSLLPPSIWSGIFNRDCLDLSLWTHWSTCAESAVLCHCQFSWPFSSCSSSAVQLSNRGG